MSSGCFSSPVKITTNNSFNKTNFVTFESKKTIDKTISILKNNFNVDNVYSYEIEDDNLAFRAHVKLFDYDMFLVEDVEIVDDDVLNFSGKSMYNDNLSSEYEVFL